MLAFWRHGYETTSITDLTAEMEITAPSLYTAFGSKKALFLEAVRLYAGDPAVTAGAIARAPSAREAAREFLSAAATAYTGENTPRGCLLASATASGSVHSTEVQAAVAEVRRGVVAAFTGRIERDAADGVLSSATEAGALANLVMAIAQGMSVLARDGVSRAELLAIVDQALNAWPSRPTEVTGGKSASPKSRRRQS